MTGSESWLDRVESKVTSVAHTAEHLAAETGEAALYAAVQEPVNGLTQLANHISKPLTGYTLPTLHLVDAPPPAKPGSADYYAEAVGTGLGRAADYAALALGLEAVGVTAAAGGALSSLFESPVAATLATSFGKAAVTGAIYGFAIMPAKDESHFWKERTVDGLGWAAGAGAASLAAAGALAAVDRVGTSLAADGLSDTILGKAIRATVGGTASGLTKNGTYALFGEPDVGGAALSARMLRSVTRSMVITEAQ
jgi:hypothetical protein